MHGRLVWGAASPLVVKLATTRISTDCQRVSASHAENVRQTVDPGISTVCRQIRDTSPPAASGVPHYDCVCGDVPLPCHWISNPTPGLTGADMSLMPSIYWPNPVSMSVPLTGSTTLMPHNIQLIGVVLDRIVVCNDMSMLWSIFSQFGEVMDMHVDSTGIYPPPPASAALVLVQMKSQLQTLAAVRALQGLLLMSKFGPIPVQVVTYLCVCILHSQTT
jgi:hypothetical protein